MTYWRLHYHLVFATFERQDLIDGEAEKIFYRVLHSKAKELGLKIHAAGGVADHMHIVLSIPPKISVAECVKNLKGVSSHAINLSPRREEHFQWQKGYCAISVSEEELDKVKAYAEKQKEHHNDRTTLAEYEKFDEEWQL